MNMKLGRRPAVFTRRSLVTSHIMAAHLAALGPAPAISPDWTTAVNQKSPLGWGMAENDTYGCCVISDTAHAEMLRTANVGNIFIPTNDQVLQLYAYFQNYAGNPTDMAAIKAWLANNDNGCDENQVIQYGQTTGFWGRKLDGFASLDPTNLEHQKWVVCLFGGSRLGVNLPQSAMTQFTNDQAWYPAGDQSPAGGHDVLLVGYDSGQAGSFYVVTWGKVQAVSPDWMTAKYPDGTPYVEEAHAELALDWMDAAGTAPSKLNLQQLLADLQEVTN